MLRAMPMTTWLEVSEEKTISEGLETLDIW